MSSQLFPRSPQNCLSCVGWRTTALTTRPASVHTIDLPNAKEYASIENKLVAVALHTHAIYCEGNADVYFLLEEATRGTQYASYLKPFQQ
eukprot:1624326-Ditylum_brightwellii.AAC.1